MYPNDKRLVIQILYTRNTKLPNVEPNNIIIILSNVRLALGKSLWIFNYDRRRFEPLKEFERNYRSCTFEHCTYSLFDSEGVECCYRFQYEVFLVKWMPSVRHKANSMAELQEISQVL